MTDLSLDTNIGELSDAVLVVLRERIANEITRRRKEKLLAGLVKGAQVRALRSGFGGGAGLVRYVVGFGKDDPQARYLVNYIILSDVQNLDPFADPRSYPLLPDSYGRTFRPSVYLLDPNDVEAVELCD